MDMKISYLDKVPTNKKRRYQNSSLQKAITDFVLSDKSVMRIDLGDHYTNPRTGRSVYKNAVKRSGYYLTVHLISEGNCLYIVKPNSKEDVPNE